ncbi:S8 family peptidase [Cohnella sp. WQ 127256]|uniref:S8 family peptidase n=1 Tax=Cohnella sp. WQ 127256 TaxID=2938790 RepID=UPI0021175FE2|nr:S8 family peptidase [Cohnella sp. WQ 127256]
MMNKLAKQLSLMVKRRPTLQTERRNIVFHREHDYRTCLKQLSHVGITPVKTNDSLRSICCYADRTRSWKHLHNHPRVAFVERDRKVKAHEVKSPINSALVIKSRIPWHVNRVKAPPLWLAAHFGNGVKVGILDTGIARHPDLRIAGGVNTIGGKSFADDNGHGTHVAGIAAATGQRKIYGVAPKVKLYAVKVLNADGAGFVSDIVEGIDWCLSHGILIMNMSFGLNGDSQLLKNAVRRAKSKGAVMVASAGNSGMQFKQIDAPARYPETVAVASTTRGNQVALFSSRGRRIDVSAPGVNILSTWLKGTYVRESGTSMSSPHVTGVVALLRSVRSGLSPSQVSRRLKMTALHIPGGLDAAGYGLVQAAPAARFSCYKIRSKNRHQIATNRAKMPI